MLLLFLGVSGGGLILARRSGTLADRDASRQRLLPGLSAAAVRAITLKRGEEPPVELVRGEDGRWEIRKPRIQDANQHRTVSGATPTVSSRSMASPSGCPARRMVKAAAK